MYMSVKLHSLMILFLDTSSKERLRKLNIQTNGTILGSVDEPHIAKLAPVVKLGPMTPDKESNNWYEDVHLANACR